MNLREIKKEHKLPSRWKKQEVFCYFEGYKKALVESQNTFNTQSSELRNIESNITWKYVVRKSKIESIIKDLK